MFNKPDYENIVTELVQRVTDLERRTQDLSALENDGGVTLLEKITVTDAVSTEILFSSISQGFSTLKLVAMVRTDNAATFDTPIMVLNGDVGDNYDWLWMEGRHEAAGPVWFASDDAVADPSAELLPTNGNNAPSGHFAPMEILFPFYTSPLIQKSWQGTGFHKEANASESLYMVFCGGVWRNLSAINQISLTPKNGTNFIEGTQVGLYGLG